MKIKIVNFNDKNKALWRRLLCVIIAIVFVLSLIPANVYAKERKTIRVGYFPFDGYHMETEDDTRSGYGYDVLQKLRVYANWNYEYVGYHENLSWQDMQVMLESGEIDLLTSATMTEERLDKFAYSDLPIGTSSTMLTVKSGNNKLTINDYDSWNGIHVGMLANNSRNGSFDEYAKTHGFSYESIEYETQDELFENLTNGNVDMIVTSNLLRIEQGWTVDQFDEKPFYVIVKKGNDKLLSEVNDALTQLKEDEPNFEEELYQQYYDTNNSGQIAFTKAEQKYIDQCNDENKVFQAIINPDRKPLTYYEDGEAKGLLTDICKLAFERSGLQVEFIPVSSRAEYISHMKEKDISVICDFSEGYSKAENAGYILTSSYYNGTAAKLVRKEYDGTGNRCAMFKSSITSTLVTGKDGVEFSYYDTLEECKDAVLHGDADYAYTYTRVAQELAYADITNSLTVVDSSDLTVNFKMGINSSENALFSSIIKKSVDSITVEDINYLSDPYTYYDKVQTSFLAMLYDNPLTVIVLIAFGLIAFFGVILIIMSSIKNKREHQINAKLSEALTYAKQANHAKSVFFSRMSHELRTPLNAIDGYASLMEQNIMNKVAKPEEQMQNLESIQHSSKYLLAMIGDILDIQKIESGKLELVKQEIDAAEYIKNILDMIRPEADEKNIKFTFERINGSSDLFLLDAVRFQQVLLNILHNAIKFTPIGGTVSMVSRDTRIDEKHIKAEFTITDNGIGMSEDFMNNHLFEKFAQENDGITSPYEGCGTGLAISKELIRLMGGEISCESKKGEGTTFVVSLPVESVERTRRTRHKRNYDIIEEKIPGVHVLFCEDNHINQELTKKILEKMQCTVDIAENGQVGVNLFRKSEVNYYDIILMDIRMPQMDGLEATRLIRTSDRIDAKKIPIVAVSANAFDEDIQKSKAAGMNEHLAKPVNMKILYQTIKEYTK